MEISEDWGELVEPAETAGPVVYHFRPTRYVRVAPERLREWEAFFVENTGLQLDESLARRLKGGRWRGSETISFAGDAPSDCDFI